jgi:hypothetical protein
MKIAIIDQTASITATIMEQVRAAMAIQVNSHFNQYYGISAVIEVHNSLPSGYWPIFIRKQLSVSGVNGFHYFAQNTPYAEVLYNADWTYTLSHELLEMLYNPYGLEFENYTDAGGQTVDYVAEVADATNGKGYKINGVMVSNFITPNYWDLFTSSTVKYDYMGLLTAPRQLADGGYMSFRDNLGNYTKAIKYKGVILYKKLLGDSSPMLYQDNPLTYLAIGVFIYILFKIFKLKK